MGHGGAPDGPLHGPSPQVMGKASVAIDASARAVAFKPDGTLESTRRMDAEHFRNSEGYVAIRSCEPSEFPDGDHAGDRTAESVGAGQIGHPDRCVQKK